MRELRQDVGYTLEPPKEDLDQIDEMKIEEVLMGLKGLKQEEVFSFLGKNNFTPAETEMTSAGLGNYDQLASVDTSDMEHLQLSFNAHFEGIQGNHSHSVSANSCMSKFTNVERFKSKIESDMYNKTLPGDIPPCSWPSIKKSKDEDEQLQQRFPSMWPRYSGAPSYTLPDYHVENLREEEIIATNIAEELISTSNVEDEDDLNNSQLNNTYVIQSSVDGVDIIPEKLKPIKLLIKRVESEDEISDSPASRVKSKRIRQPSVKRRLEEMSPPKRKRTKRPSMSKSKEKIQLITNTKQKNLNLDELDFPFANTIHQDDDYVYPSLDISDEEDDVYSFSQRDDETWTPKIKMKINDTKNERPARDRKRNNAVAKYLEAAAMKRADTDSSNPTNPKYTRKFPRKKDTANTKKQKTDDDLINLNKEEYLLDEFSSSKMNVSNSTSLPSTSKTLSSTYNDSYYMLSSYAESSSGSELIESKNSRVRKSVGKSRNESGVKNARRIIPPKTCKLVQELPGAKPTTLTVQMNSAKKLKSSMSVTNSPTCSTSTGEKKSSSATYITKRGKPKKGMATAKQRLGKILKMHKMFF